MFEETLLIIKNDYLPKRKVLLIKLLGYGFQIQTNRRIIFTPELAAQFYGENSDEDFMLQIFVLSKGASEAFILTMENAVEQLINAVICYFCTSSEMERHVHVSKTLQDACREIKFIFPNYICEPIPYFDKSQFCKSADIAGIIAQVYDIIKTQDEEPKEDWKVRLAEWLLRSSDKLPIISNECSTLPHRGFEEKSVQTKSTGKKKTAQQDDASVKSLITSGTSLGGSSAQLTSSSCISCHRFGSSARTDDRDICVDLVLAKTALSEAEAELRRRPKLKVEEEECEEQVCEVEVEYIVLPDEQGAEENFSEEEQAAQGEQLADDYVEEGGNTPPRAASEPEVVQVAATITPAAATPGTVTPGTITPAKSAASSARASSVQFKLDEPTTKSERASAATAEPVIEEATPAEAEIKAEEPAAAAE